MAIVCRFLLTCILYTSTWAQELASLNIKELKIEAHNAGVSDDIIKAAKNKDALIAEINLKSAPASELSFDSDAVPMIAALFVAALIGLLILNANGSKSPEPTETKEDKTNGVPDATEVKEEAVSQGEEKEVTLKFSIQLIDRKAPVGLGLQYTNAPKMVVNEAKHLAQEAGLQVGDQVVSIGGTPCATFTKVEFERKFLSLKSDEHVKAIEIGVIRN